MSASTTRPVQHSAPLLLSIFARPHQNGLISCWRADSLGLCLALDPGITPCCKSPKSPDDNFPAKRRSDQRPPISAASNALPRSPVSLSSGDEVPHIFTRKSRLQPGEFLIPSGKRLLQHNPPESGHRATRLACPPSAISDRRPRDVGRRRTPWY